MAGGSPPPRLVEEINCEAYSTRITLTAIDIETASRIQVGDELPISVTKAGTRTVLTASKKGVGAVATIEDQQARRAIIECSSKGVQFVAKASSISATVIRVEIYPKNV